MSRRVLYKGRAWNEEDLTESVRYRILDISDHAVNEEYMFGKAMESHTRVLYEQNAGDRSPGKYFADITKAQNEYWRGCSPEMNGRVSNG